MKITSVKLLNDGASIDWQTMQGETLVRHAVKNGTEPAPSFQAAVDELKDDVRELMEYANGYVDTVTVKGLSASYDDDGTIEASLSFTKRFKCGRAVGYSTKRVRQRADQAEKGCGFMSEELEARVKTVLKEAEGYVDGLRSQVEHP